MRGASVSGLTLSFPWNESVATVHICIVALEKSVMQFYFSMSAKGAPNENIVQNHLNIALLNVF